MTMIFDVENKLSKNELLVKRISEKCDKFHIIQCYKNKLEYNCKYHSQVEEIINEIAKELTDVEQLPWWLDLID